MSDVWIKRPNVMRMNQLRNFCESRDPDGGALALSGRYDRGLGAAHLVGFCDQEVLETEDDHEHAEQGDSPALLHALLLGRVDGIGRGERLHRDPRLERGGVSTLAPFKDRITYTKRGRGCCNEGEESREKDRAERPAGGEERVGLLPRVASVDERRARGQQFQARSGFQPHHQTHHVWLRVVGAPGVGEKAQAESQALNTSSRAQYSQPFRKSVKLGVQISAEPEVPSEARAGGP